MTGLWRRPAFVAFWAGQAASLVGDQVSALALPLVAITTLGAGAADLGGLQAARGAPVLVLGLLAGVWVDRLPRRPVLLGADLGRALLLASVPLAAAGGAASLAHLYVVALGLGAGAVVFAVAAPAYLTALLPRAQLVPGNAALTATRAVADTGGPGLGGAAVQALTAPGALLVDAGSFAVSAVCLGAVRPPAAPAPAPAAAPGPPPAPRRPVWREARAGLQLVAADPLLRASAGAAGTYNLCNAARLAVYLLYLTSDLGLGPAAVGAVLAGAGPGAFAGALLAAPAQRRFGVGPVLLGGLALAGLANALVPLAGLAAGHPAAVVGGLAAAAALNGLGQPLYNIPQVSLRQAVTPAAYQGRVNATMQVLAGAAAPLGALAGGALGQTVGVWPTLLGGALGTLAAGLWLWASPVRRLHELPAPPADGPASVATAGA